MVSWVFSEPMMYYYIKLLIKSWWPNGKLMTAPSPRTEEEKLNTRYKNVVVLLHANVYDSGTLI
jgi:sorting nexin-25